MVNILLAFFTGLTTGGLSCLAVQGGLLASSLANQIEKDIQYPVSGSRRKKAQVKPQTQLALPILAFLLAKLAAYTLLGLLLGQIGQAFQLSTYARAFLQIAIGIFMFGTAMRMLNVHPIFRYFAFEPPAFIRRRLRKTAAGASDSSLITPIFLGLLTVLIPCGVTQAMMAAALGTADPAQGAALMFAFTLGTSPVFFAVAYFATRLGKKLEKNFTRVIAVVILVLAIITIDSGVTLAGSPVSLTRLVGGVFSQPSETVTQGSDPASSLATIQVKNSGYSPNEIHAKSGAPFKLRMVSKNVSSCSRSFVIPKIGVSQLLPANGEALIDIPAQKKGTRLDFSCSMGMYTGTIYFD